MASCNVCRKSFNSEQALRQHSEDSPAHKRLVRCDPCNRSFPNSEALAQHTSNSPAHKNNHTCQPCQRSFPSSEALVQHVNNSSGHAAATATAASSPPPHKPTASTATSAAPAQRPPPSPAAAVAAAAAPIPKPNQPHHPCETCTRSFTTASALSQHTRDSHAGPTHPCPSCPRPRSFRSASALAQHIRDTPSHHNDNNINDNNKKKEEGEKEKKEKKKKKKKKKKKNKDKSKKTRNHNNAAATTPLDAFFLSYGPSFRYDLTLPASASWRDLCAHKGWRKYKGEYVDPDARDARELYVFALRLELEVWFGGEDDLKNWQALCRAVGVVPPPEGEKECERALRGTHVNLVDLVAWARREKEVEEGLMGYGNDTVKVFGSVGALAEYCAETGKWFPLNEVAEAGKQGDGKVVIRHLLRKLRVRY